MKEREEMITQSGVLLRTGWSKTLIVKLLGEPDFRRKVSGRSIPLCLYRIDRVAGAELTSAFSAAQDSIAKRKAAATKAVQTKTNKLVAEIDEMPVSVKLIGLQYLRQLAIDDYNERNPYGYEPASAQSDAAFLNRICVNYIRHQLTAYDHTLWEISGRTGKSIAVTSIRRKIYEAIAKAYPVFHDECSRQMQHRSGVNA